MAWVRAVWREGKVEEMCTVPNTWVNMEEGEVYWPPVSNAIQHLAERRQPKSSWRRFPLIKVKFQSGWFFLFFVHFVSINVPFVMYCQLGMCDISAADNLSAIFIYRIGGLKSLIAR